jgi:hypothetical protein
MVLYVKFFVNGRVYTLSLFTKIIELLQLAVGEMDFQNLSVLSNQKE